MESRYKLEMCRLCLCENECFVNIFELNDWQGYVAAEVISDLLQFQVSESDGYPHVVCLTCLTKLTDFRLFKECCQKSKVVYDDMFASHESLVEHKPEMVQLTAVDSVSQSQHPQHLEHEGPRCTSKGAVDADACTGNVKTDDESIFQKSKNNSLSLEEEASSSGTVEELEEQEMSPGEMYTASLIHEDIDISMEVKKKRGRKENETGGEGKGRRLTAPGVRADEEKEGLECYHCGNMLMTKRTLIQHMALHGFGHTHDCDVCGKAFQTNYGLMRHGLIHTGSKPYKCKKCSKRFREYGNLKQHMRVHTGSKLYKCAECGRRYSKNSTLKAHMSSHWK